jgi:hypothetical protein
MRWPWKELSHEVPRSYVATPRLGGRSSGRRRDLSDRRGSGAARDRALPIEHPPRNRRAFRGRHLRAGDGPPARPGRQPGNVPGLLRLPRGDGGDHGRPERHWGFRPGRAGASPVRARRQHGAVRHVPRRDPLVGREAPRVRRRCRGCRGDGLRRGDEARQLGPLEERGITVERGILRDEAASVLREYVEKGGEIYNARRGG